jgi:hypothetical protein
MDAFVIYCAFLAVMLRLGSVEGGGVIRPSPKSASTQTQVVEDKQGGMSRMISHAAHLHKFTTNDISTLTFQALDISALQSIYKSTNGDDWTNNSGWLTSSDLDTWFGVNAISNSVVTEIALHGNNLVGMCV